MNRNAHLLLQRFQALAARADQHRGYGRVGFHQERTYRLLSQQPVNLAPDLKAYRLFR